MAECTGGIDEHERLIDLLSSVPTKAQKGLFKQPLTWTCIDATDEYIAVGTDAGLTYLFDRETTKVKKLMCPVSTLLHAQRGLIFALEPINDISK